MNGGDISDGEEIKMERGRTIRVGGGERQRQDAK